MRNKPEGVQVTKVTGGSQITQGLFGLDLKRRWVKEVKGLRSTDWQYSHRDAKYSIGIWSIIL